VQLLAVNRKIQLTVLIGVGNECHHCHHHLLVCNR
jgi:hypothetical protein